MHQGYLKNPSFRYSMAYSFSLLQTKSRPFDRWFSLLFFGLLLVWAAISFQERVGYLDSSVYLYNMLEKESFFGAHHRYGAFFTQVIPVSLILLKAPLKLVMIGYSLNFILVSFACYYFSMFRWQNRKVAYAIALFMVFSVGPTFYWPVSEMFLSLVYAMTFYAWWTAPIERAPWKLLLGGSLLIVLAINTYIAVVIPLGFLLTYDFLDQKVWRNWRRILVWGLTCLVVVVVWKLKGTTDYEQDRTQLVERVPEILPDLFEYYGAKLILHLQSGTYGVFLVSMVVITLLLLAQRKLMKLLVLYFFYSAYFVVLVAVFPYGEMPLMVENLMLPFAFFLTLTICKEGFESYRMVRILIFVWIGLSFIRIVDSRQPFLDRGHYYEVLMENVSKNFPNRPSQKLVCSSGNYGSHLDYLFMVWPFFSESLLYSGLKNKENCFMLYVGGQNHIEYLENLEHPEEYILYARWRGLRPYADLPQDYFPIPPQPFTILNTANELSDDSLRALLSESTVEWLDPVQEMKTQDFIYAKIRVKYQGRNYLPSGTNVPAPFYLTHRFFYQGNEVDWIQRRIPLIIDVKSELIQMIPIKMPDQEVDVEIEFSLINTTIGAEVRSVRMPIKIRN